jgi:hypothetical protein
MCSLKFIIWNRLNCADTSWIFSASPGCFTSTPSASHLMYLPGAGLFCPPALTVPLGTLPLWMFAILWWPIGQVTILGELIFACLLATLSDNVATKLQCDDINNPSPSPGGAHVPDLNTAHPPRLHDSPAPASASPAPKCDALKPLAPRSRCCALHTRAGVRVRGSGVDTIPVRGRPGRRVCGGSGSEKRGWGRGRSTCESWVLGLRGSEAGVAACSEREGRGIWKEGGDLGEVMRWGISNLLGGCEGVLGRGLDDLVESAIWILMRCGFRRC